MQGSNGDADRENGLTDKEEGGMNGKSRMETYAFSSVQSLSHVPHDLLVSISNLTCVKRTDNRKAKNEKYEIAEKI